MPVICPAILAEDERRYRQQIEKVAHYAHRIQIDLTDGKFAKNQTVKPEKAWWPVGVKADFHLMFEDPSSAVETILEHQPHLIIVHAEAKGSFEAFASRCHGQGVKVGVALLPKTSPQAIESALSKIDHVLIFSGNLGSYGGHADLDLLHKVHYLKERKPEIEIGWDGGVTDQNISQLATGGVDVFAVGGFIQNSQDPERTFHKLQRIADETGST
jgi:ribulose-phosphate 3-epimerase